VEAMACGTPVVAAAAGSLPEVIADGGQLVKPGDPIGLSTVLRQLLSDNTKRDEWAHAARVRAATFSWARTAQLTEDVLREAAAEPLARVWTRRVARVPRTLARSVFPIATQTRPSTYNRLVTDGLTTLITGAPQFAWRRDAQ
jgi:hypothetical protein